MSAALTKEQKRYLAQLGRSAFFRQRALAMGRGEEWAHEEEQWRHEQVAIAAGKLGLRCCSQDDYGAVKAHFLTLNGEEGKALKADFYGRVEMNRKRVVDYKIDAELKALGKSRESANGISRRMFRGKDLDEVGEKQAWKVFYALRYEVNRRAA